MGLSTVSVFKNIDIKNNPNLIELDDIKLHQLQGVLFGMLKEFDAFCRENGIQYSLAGGSMLGAVRHGGFIPWDDDVDLLMTRNDYNKLRKCFDSGLGSGYWLHTPEDTHDYGLGMARLRKKGTICRSREDLNNDDCGVYLDIFIMENTYNFLPMRYLHGFLSLAVGFILSCRCFWKNKDFYLDLVKNDSVSKKVFKKKVFLGRVFSFLSLDAWTHLWNRINSMCKLDDTSFVTVPTGRMHFFKETYTRSWACAFKDIDYSFDGDTASFMVMEGTDEYLRMLYGDYMKLPDPKDIEKHIVLELKL